MNRKIFYNPAELFVKKTTAVQRRAINFWFFIFWLLPGTFIWFILKDDLWFVGFMSLYAIWISHWGGYSAETPTEGEDD